MGTGVLRGLRSTITSIRERLVQGWEWGQVGVRRREVPRTCGVPDLKVRMDVVFFT